MIRLVDDRGREIILMKYGNRIRFRLHKIYCSARRCGTCPHHFIIAYWRDKEGIYKDKSIGSVFMTDADQGA